MTIRIKRWQGIVIAVFLVLALAGILIAALQGPAGSGAVGTPLAAVPSATPTPVPTWGWWVTATVQWEDWEATSTFTSTEGCAFGSQYVADVTIPDGEVLNPGEGFVKTWKVKNSGTCDWGEGYELVFLSGARMDGPESVPLPVVPAGEAGDISVDLIVPSAPGSHTGTWRIKPRGGEAFGTNLTVVIEVTAEGTVVPTMVPIATPALDASPVPSATPAGRW
ncbi:MAG: hypothetical protein JW704_12955 [Anaerolineaceae bacterium]|nr:hypothetical protein [Anaerolineaceae bacterium]